MPSTSRCTDWQRCSRCHLGLSHPRVRQFLLGDPGSGDSSTIAEQRLSNPALTQDEQAYVAELLEGLSAYPAYYAHMGVINQAGPAPVDLSLPEPVDPEEVRRRIDAGQWVVDLRNRTAFAAGHLSGTLGFELSGSFVTYLGWLHRWGEPLTLIGETLDQIAEARRELVRIGVDHLDGAATGNIDDLRAGSTLRCYRTAGFADLAETLGSGEDFVVLDVRQRQEHDTSRIPGAINIPLHLLADRLHELPDMPIWVHCGSGYRASIAASIIDREGASWCSSMTSTAPRTPWASPPHDNPPTQRDHGRPAAPISATWLNCIRRKANRSPSAFH